MKEKPPDSPETQHAPVKTRRRRKNTLVIVVLLWLGFMAFLVVVAKRFSGREWDGSVADGGKLEMRAQAMEDQKFLQDEMPRVFQTFAGYVVSATNEQRSQFVADPIRVSPKMVRYFSQNPMIRLEPDQLVRQAGSVLSIGGEKGIEVVWQAGDQVYETLFIRDVEGDWKLDWEHFVRYSDSLFSVFLAGGGLSEGEFRLLARERLAKERADEPELSLTLYSPVPGKPREVGVASPEILVPRHEPVGERLTAAFAMRARGERAFSSRLPVGDSDDLIRIRVKLRRSEDEEGKKRFEIAGLPACHWLGVAEDVETGVGGGDREGPERD